MEEDKVVADNSNTAEETVAPETTTEEESIESVRIKLEEERKARLKAEEIATNQKIRAEKAEGRMKEARVDTKVETKTSELTSKDAIVLMGAGITKEEDVDEVLDYAKYKGISVSEALKSNVIKASLAEKAEQRKVAEATNVGTSKRGSGKVPDDVLLTNASKGILPEVDSEEFTRLMNLRKGIKK